MISDITIGQYYPLDSPIHRLDPRTKIKATLLFVMFLFAANNFLGFGIAAAFVVGVVLVSRIPPGYVLRGIKPIATVLALTVILNLLFTSGETIASFWIFRITDKGAKTAFNMGFRLILLICGTSMMTLTTSAIALTDGMERLIARIPIVRRLAHEIAMMMSIALRFIPTLIEETDRIMKAQKSRGADFESHNIASRAKALVPVLVPLFISAFHRADELAMAMESRCYQGGENRTRMKELVYARQDRMAMALVWAVMVALVGSRFVGLPFFWA